MLSRLSIGIRLLLLIAVPLAALVIVGLGGLAAVNASGAVTEETRERFERQALLADADDALRRGLLDTARAAALGTLPQATAARRLSEARDRLESTLASYMDRFGSRPTEGSDALAGALPAALAEFTAAIDAVESRDEAPLRTIAAGAGGGMLTALDRAVAAERAATARIMEQSLARDRSFLQLNALLSVAGLGLALLFGYYIVRSINRPLGQITSTVHAVAAGDLDKRTQLDGIDEISELSRALDDLLDDKVATLARTEAENARLNESVIALLRAVSRLSKRDLTVRVPVTEDVTGPVADAINQLASATGKVLQDVSKVAGQVAEVSSRVKTKAQSVSSATRSQQSEALDTADKLSHAAERLAEIAQLALHCNSLAQDAAQSTEAAVETVTGTLDGMKDIREIIQETGKRIKRLGERSQEIGSIVDIINNVAERTTILALNVSMQAAAAGEAGRGFGVVADEVQRLAESSRSATAQIDSLVKNIQVETRDTIASVERAIGQVVEGSKLAEEAGRQIGATHGATSTLVQSVLQIASSSQEQSQLSETLLERSRKILQGVQSTSAEAQDQLKQTDHLMEFSERLLTSVRVFKLSA